MPPNDRPVFHAETRGDVSHRRFRPQRFRQRLQVFRIFPDTKLRRRASDDLGTTIAGTQEEFAVDLDVLAVAQGVHRDGIDAPVQ
jgi:hypothetical protein